MANQKQTQGIAFEEVVERGCGLDVHKKEIVATVSGTGIESETRTFRSTTRSLTELKEWLLAHGVTQCSGFTDMPRLTYLRFLSFVTLSIRGDSLLLNILTCDKLRLLWLTRFTRWFTQSAFSWCIFGVLNIKKRATFCATL